MSLPDELAKLAALKRDGVITENEFARAKSKLLATTNEPPSPRYKPSEDTVGRAANRYVTLQTVMTIIGLIVFLFFGLPFMCSVHEKVNAPIFPTPR